MTSKRFHCDNEGSILMVINPRTKFLVNHHHYIRKMIKAGDICLKNVSLVEHIVDIFTKPFGKGLFEKFKKKLEVISLVHAKTIPPWIQSI